MHIYITHLVCDVGFCAFGVLAALLRCFVESSKWSLYATEMNQVENTEVLNLIG